MSLVDPWSHRYAHVNGVRLHYLEAGDPGTGPTVLLLHGFPDFSYTWRHQIPALAAAGCHVVAPDLRGYNLSEKPPRVTDYRIEHLAGDVAALARRVSPGERVLLAGHDWGGAIAWCAAMWHADVVERLAVLNGPHPAAYLRELRTNPSQLLRSWYVFFFQLPWLPEAAIRFDGFAPLKRLLRHEPARPGAFTEADLDRYAATWSQPHALRSGVNYYRASLRRSPAGLRRDIRPIRQPTLIVWGMKDPYLVPAQAEGLEPWVTDLRVERLPAATHWVHHDEPERVNRILNEFAVS